MVILYCRTQRLKGDNYTVVKYKLKTCSQLTERYQSKYINLQRFLYYTGISLNILDKMDILNSLLYFEALINFVSE